MFRKKSARVLLSTAVVLGILAFPQLAYAADDASSDNETESEQEVASPSPTPSVSWTPKSPKPEPTEHSTSLQRPPVDQDLTSTISGGDFEAHEHRNDISTPPLLIRPESSSSQSGTTNGGALATSSNDKAPSFYSAPLGFYLERQFTDTDLDNSTAGVSTFDATANAPVIENIVYTDYSTPADEFMSRSYLGIGVLAVGAGTLLTVVLRRNRSKHDDLT